MKTKFAQSWKSSVQPRKQRKFRYNAPLHVKQKFVSAHLSPDLRKKHSTRSLQLRKGDSVKILRGQFRKKTGKVEAIDLGKTKVFVAGIEIAKKDGTKVRFGLNPTNVMITELNTDDKRRIKTEAKK